MKKAIRVILLVFLATLIFQFLRIVSFQKLRNPRSLQPFFKKGVFHVHSRFSDGAGDVAHIAAAAEKAKVDFVVLTDHGRPNVEAIHSTCWLHNALIIGGSELSLESGHLAAIGFEPPPYRLPPEAQDAVDEIKAAHGWSAVSHPFDKKVPWRDGNVRGVDGIEIFSVYYSAKKASLFRLLAFPMQYLMSPEYAVTSLFTYPEKEIRLWDEWNRRSATAGIYALDAHGKLPLTSRIMLPFPSYETLFKTLNIYVKIDRELDRDPRLAAATIVSSLSRRRFLNVIETLAPANGFDFYYLDKEGRKAEMGDQTESVSGAVHLSVPFDFPTDISLKRDGLVIARVPNNWGKELTLPVSGAGAYRAEVFLSGSRFSRLPWILTNPIFLGNHRSTPSPVLAAVVSKPLRMEAGLHAENNQRTMASYACLHENDASVYSLDFRIWPESDTNPNYWAALARRQNDDWRGARGISFLASSSSPLRFWIQFRTDRAAREYGYRHSFFAGPQWQRVVIPFDRFVPLGDAEPIPDLERISSLFFLIDGDLAYPGTSGTLKLKDIGLF